MARQWRAYDNLTSPASVSGSFSHSIIIITECRLPSESPTPAVSTVTELTLTPSSLQVQRGCSVPFVPLRSSQIATIQEQYLCVHLLAPGTAGKTHCRVPVSQPLCSSLSDAMWNAPSCHQTQYPTYKTHRGIITRSLLACQHFPLAAESC